MSKANKKWDKNFKSDSDTNIHNKEHKNHLNFFLDVPNESVAKYGIKKALYLSMFKAKILNQFLAKVAYEQTRATYNSDDYTQILQRAKTSGYTRITQEKLDWVSGGAKSPCNFGVEGLLGRFGRSKTFTVLGIVVFYYLLAFHLTKRNVDNPILHGVASLEWYDKYKISKDTRLAYLHLLSNNRRIFIIIENKPYTDKYGFAKYERITHIRNGAHPTLPPKTYREGEFGRKDKKPHNLATSTTISQNLTSSSQMPTKAPQIDFEPPKPVIDTPTPPIPEIKTLEPIETIIPEEDNKIMSKINKSVSGKIMSWTCDCKQMYPLHTRQCGVCNSWNPNISDAEIKIIEAKEEEKAKIGALVICANCGEKISRLAKSCRKCHTRNPLFV